MVIPEIFIKFLFYVLRRPKWRDSFYAFYGDHLQSVGQLEIYEFLNIGALCKKFPKRVKVTDTGYIFNNVVVMEDGIIAFDKKTFFVSDRYVLYTIIRRLSSLRRAVPKVKLATGFLMCGNYSSSFNFFHFLTDSLAPNFNPKITSSQFPILVPVICNNFQLEVLDKLNITNYLEVDSAIEVENLSLNLRESKWNRDVYKRARSALGVSDKSAKSSKKIIYSTRLGRARNYKNEDKLIKFLKSYDVEVVDFAAISLDERITLLNQTSILIGQYGAGLTNLVFLPSGGYVIDLQTVNVHRNDYCLLANACGVGYINVPFHDRFFSNQRSYTLVDDDFYHIKVAVGFIMAAQESDLTGEYC